MAIAPKICLSSISQPNIDPYATCEYWIVVVDDISSVVEPSRDHAYLTPDNELYIWDYNANKLIRVDSNISISSGSDNVTVTTDGNGHFTIAVSEPVVEQMVITSAGGSITVRQILNGYNLEVSTDYVVRSELDDYATKSWVESIIPNYTETTIISSDSTIVYSEDSGQYDLSADTNRLITSVSSTTELDNVVVNNIDQQDTFHAVSVIGDLYTEITGYTAGEVGGIIGFAGMANSGNDTINRNGYFFGVAASPSATSPTGATYDAYVGLRNSSYTWRFAKLSDMITSLIDTSGFLKSVESPDDSIAVTISDGIAYISVPSFVTSITSTDGSVTITRGDSGIIDLSVEPDPGLEISAGDNIILHDVDGVTQIGFGGTVPTPDVEISDNFDNLSLDVYHSNKYILSSDLATDMGLETIDGYMDVYHSKEYEYSVTTYQVDIDTLSVKSYQFLVDTSSGVNVYHKTEMTNEAGGGELSVAGQNDAIVTFDEDAGIYTVNTVVPVKALVEGGNIKITEDPTGTFSIQAIVPAYVSDITGTDYITVISDDDMAYYISNNGVLAVISGSGINVSGTVSDTTSGGQKGVLTISNTGVISLSSNQSWISVNTSTSGAYLIDANLANGVISDGTVNVIDNGDGTVTLGILTDAFVSNIISGDGYIGTENVNGIVTLTNLGVNRVTDKDGNMAGGIISIDSASGDIEINVHGDNEFGNIDINLGQSIPRTISAGDGISVDVSSATGNDYTITNTGVLKIVGDGGILVDTQTGEVHISAYVQDVSGAHDWINVQDVGSGDYQIDIDLGTAITAGDGISIIENSTGTLLISSTADSGIRKITDMNGTQISGDTVYFSSSDGSVNITAGDSDSLDFTVDGYTSLGFVKNLDTFGRGVTPDLTIYDLVYQQSGIVSVPASQAPDWGLPGYNTQIIVTKQTYEYTLHATCSNSGNISQIYTGFWIDGIGFSWKRNDSIYLNSATVNFSNYMLAAGESQNIILGTTFVNSISGLPTNYQYHGTIHRTASSYIISVHMSDNGEFYLTPNYYQIEINSTTGDYTVVTAAYLSTNQTGSGTVNV